MAGCDEAYKVQRHHRLWRAAAWIAPLAVYFALAVPLAYQHRENVLGDAVSYIRRALYLSQGDLYHSISGYWSPMISWCMAPLMALGMDGAYAARVVLVGWGAVLVVMAGVLLQVFTNLGTGWRVASLCAIAVATADVGAEHVTPDVLLAAWLMGYFAMMVSPGLMQRKGLQFGAGVLGGIAYLAKAYAFPFVLVHVPMTLAIRGWVAWRETRQTQSPGCTSGALVGALKAWALIMVGFALVAGPWVGVLSWRYGHFTFSTSGSRAHAVVGPYKQSRQLPALQLMPDPYIVPWENPEDLKYRFWSPLENEKFFMHQVGVVQENGEKMLQTFWNLDLLHLAVVGLVLSPVAMLLGRGRGWRIVWLVATMGVYCSGFLLVWYSERYIMGVVIPLTLLLCLEIVSGIGSRFSRRKQEPTPETAACDSVSPVPALPLGEGEAKALVLDYRTPLARKRINIARGAIMVLGALVIVSFAGAGARNVHHLATNVQRSGVYRQVAGQIHKLGVTGAIGSTEMYKGYFTCLHADRKLVFVPPEEKPEVLDQKLKECGVEALVVWGRKKGGGVEQLLANGHWRRAWSRGEGVEVYVPMTSGKDHDG